MMKTNLNAHAQPISPKFGLIVAHTGRGHWYKSIQFSTASTNSGKFSGHEIVDDSLILGVPKENSRVTYSVLSDGITEGEHCQEYEKVVDLKKMIDGYSKAIKREEIPLFKKFQQFLRNRARRDLKNFLENHAKKLEEVKTKLNEQNLAPKDFKTAVSILTQPICIPK